MRLLISFDMLQLSIKQTSGATLNSVEWVISGSPSPWHGASSVCR